MSVNPTLVAMVDRVLAELPALGRQVLESAGQALQRNPKHFALQEPWAKRRSRFVHEFDTELRPQLTQLRNTGTLARGGALPGGSGLSLVDEHQALRDVAIAHVVELCNEASSTELFQIGNFFTGLNRGVLHGRDLNALRPGLFARALTNALAGPDLNADGHYQLVRAVAPGLAAALAPLYQQLVGLLQRADLGQLVSTRVGHAQRRRQDAPHARDSGPGRLADWHARSQSISSRPQPLVRSLEGSGQSLLDRLYERILADPQLSSPVKAQLARLQVAVSRLAVDDPSLLRREDHPTWRLINAVAAYASGFARADNPQLDEFLRFLQEQTQALIETTQPSSAQFEYLLRLVDAFIARQARSSSQPSHAALEQIEREQQRGEWLMLLREQLGGQAQPLAKPVREFLLGPWAEVIVQAMVQDGQGAPTVQNLVQLVDELLDSLKPRRDALERERLRQGLPLLVGRIERALSAVQVPEARRKSVMLALMQLHTKSLSGPARADQPDEAEVSRFLEERESEFGSVWAHIEVDRASLLTQPLPLPDVTENHRAAQAQQWLDGLAIGGWFHLFVDGGWDTAQLVWIGPDRKLFLFVGQNAGARHSVTAGALLQLYLNGLAMYLEQEGLLDRALGTLMQDLGP